MLSTIHIYVKKFGQASIENSLNGSGPTDIGIDKNVLQNPCVKPVK